ncbi:hypothetical protein F4825DRAFT_222631 [Nemania diffusa]|nr:hypothetical protein F4825DRAFT_222631 [Nemania diffusa]
MRYLTLARAVAAAAGWTNENGAARQGDQWVVDLLCPLSITDQSVRIILHRLTADFFQLSQFLPTDTTYTHYLRALLTYTHYLRARTTCTHYLRIQYIHTTHYLHTIGRCHYTTDPRRPLPRILSKRYTPYLSTRHIQQHWYVCMYICMYVRYIHYAMYATLSLHASALHTQVDTYIYTPVQTYIQLPCQVLL